MAEAPISAYLDETQWKDTFTWDGATREAVPAIRPEDVIELQIICQDPRIVAWEPTAKHDRSLQSLPGSDGLHRISGPIREWARDLQGRPSVILDGPVPIVCYLRTSRQGEDPEAALEAGWVNLETVLEAEISFAGGPLYAPLVARVISVEPRAVVTDYFGNPHPGHYLLTILPAPGSTFVYSYSRMNLRKRSVQGQ